MSFKINVELFGRINSFSFVYLFQDHWKMKSLINKEINQALKKTDQMIVTCLLFVTFEF